MSKPRLNLVGKKFGKLTVVLRIEPMVGKTKFECVCDCGNKSVVVGQYLQSGNTTSCGCVKKSVGFTSNLIHGGSAGNMHGAYRSWRSMKHRCTCPSSIGWKDYGARGITVCERWLDSYELFLEDMGHRPKGYSLERLDIEKGYSPENCVWIPNKHQAKNNRRTVRYLVGNEIIIQADLAKKLNIHPSSLMEMRKQNRLPQGIAALTS
jgi:hypothetical protein